MTSIIDEEVRRIRKEAFDIAWRQAERNGKEVYFDDFYSLFLDLLGEADLYGCEENFIKENELYRGMKYGK